MARSGQARQAGTGIEWQGGEWQGVAGKVRRDQASRGVAWQARIGKVRQGVVGQGRLG